MDGRYPPSAADKPITSSDPDGLCAYADGDLCISHGTDFGKIITNGSGHDVTSGDHATASGSGSRPHQSNGKPNYVDQHRLANGTVVTYDNGQQYVNLVNVTGRYQLGGLPGVKIPTLDELGRWTDDFIGANPTEQDLYDPENTATAIFAGYSAGSNRGGPMGLYLFSKSNSGRGQIGLAAGSNLELLGAAMLGGPRRVPGCGGNSFVGDTPILMADGTSKAIKDIDVGDQVEATDPSTQTTNVEPVTQLHLNYDTDLADLMLTTTDGHQSILHTTQNHLFWDATTQQWTPTTQLQPGDTLYNVDGRSVRVTAVHEFTAPHDMYNLTVNDIHTYYVIAGGLSS